MNKNYKIAVAGNQWITKFLIEKLIENNFKPSLIINCCPEKSLNISGYYDLEKNAELHGIELYRPDKYSLSSEIDKINLLARQIDLLIVFGWQRLIPEWLIEHTSFGVYGVHGGPEKPPRARGRAVFNWSILLGYQKFYMYLFKITPEVDSGKIVEMTEFDILDSDDITSVYHKNCIVSVRMILKNLPLIFQKKTELIEQSEENATYLPKRVPEYSGIYWDKPAKEIVNLIRAVAPPYPCAYSILNDNKVEIRRAHIFDKQIKFNAEPGVVLEVFPNNDFLVMASDYPVYVRDYVCENNFLLKSGDKFQIHSGQQPDIPII